MKPKDSRKVNNFDLLISFNPYSILNSHFKCENQIKKERKKYNILKFTQRNTVRNISKTMLFMLRKNCNRKIWKVTDFMEFFLSMSFTVIPIDVFLKY